MPRSTAFPILALLGTATAIAVPHARFQQQPTFRTGVEVFHLDVSVLDRARRPVRGLSASAFTVLEDGVPQKIVALSEVELPAARPPAAVWMSQASPDVASNQLRDRRLFVMVLDDASFTLNIALIDQAVKSLKTTAHAIVERLGPDDLMAIVYTADNRRPQNFTNDRAKLRAAIDRFTRLGGLSTGLAALMTVDTLARAAEFLIEIPERRKALLYLGTGAAVTPLSGAAPAMISLNSSMWSREVDIRSAQRLMDIFPAAQRANVNIYAFDAMGLRANASVPAVEFMQTIAGSTGGRAFINRNDLEAGVPQLFEENAAYYLLGYESSAIKGPGHWRRIEVRVSQPGVDVRARTRHYADSPVERAEDPLASARQALAGLLPEGAIPLRVSLAPFALPGQRDLATVAAVLAIDTPGPPFAAPLQDLSLDVSAFDLEGRPRGSRRYTVRVPPAETPGGVLTELISRTDLKPGRYELRLAVHATSSTLRGSVYADVEIPDFANDPVSLSGLLLTSSASPRSAPRLALAPLIPVQPTARRTFSPAEQVTAFMRIYQGGGARVALQPVDVRVTIVDAAGDLLFSHEEGLPPDRFTDRAADLQLALPAARLGSGPHLLTVDARTPRAAVTRSLPFEIR
jgi:VWFA-related protein